MAEKVTLHIYDVSKGLVKLISRSAIGKQVDGVWHTGIVVYGKEHAYNGTALLNDPFQTIYGKPAEIIEIGTTEVPCEKFEVFLKELYTNKYNAQTYHPITNNCNHFTNELSIFLTNNSLPDRIMNFADEVLDSKFGAMIKPQVTQFFSAGYGPNLISSLVMAQGPLLSQVPGAPSTNNKTHPRFIVEHKHTKLSLPSIAHSEVLLDKTTDDVEANFSKLFSIVDKDKETYNLTQDDEANLQQIQKYLISNENIPESALETLEKLIKILSPDNISPALDILRLVLLQGPPNGFYSFVKNPFIIELLKVYTKNSPLSAHLLTYRLALNMFSSKVGINYMVNTPGHLSIVIDCIESSLQLNNTEINKSVANLFYNTCLFIDKRQSEEVLQKILSIVIRLLSITPPNDPNTDIRPLLALGGLLYCNDRIVNIAQSLNIDIDSVLSPFVASNISNVNEIAKEVTSMLQ